MSLFALINRTILWYIIGGKEVLLSNTLLKYYLGG